MTGLFGFEVEELDETAPAFAGLKGALFRIFVFGVLGGGTDDQPAEPALDQESSKVEWVVFFFKKCLGILEISHKRQATDGGGVLQVHAGLAA